MGLDFFLILAGVILLFAAAFRGSLRDISLLPLGLALIALTLLTGCGDRDDRILNQHLSTNEVIVNEDMGQPIDEVCDHRRNEVCK